VNIARLDHLVLTVRDIQRTVRWYEQVLCMQPIEFAGGRRALTFGDHKLNLHEVGRELEPKAAAPTPGAIDVCLISAVGLDAVLAHLTALGVPIEEGPVGRSGALGPITSLYVRDPDGNLVELSVYDAEAGRAP